MNTTVKRSLVKIPVAAIEALSPQDCAAEMFDVIPAAMDALRQAMRKHVGDQLSVPQFRCLRFIDREKGCSIGAVAVFLGVSKPTASALVDRLVRAGLVLPRTAPDDRRRSELYSTDAGRAQLQKIRRSARKELAKTLAACKLDELLALHTGLAVLQRTFLTESP